VHGLHHSITRWARGKIDSGTVRPCGLEADHKFEPGRLLNRNIAGLGSSVLIATALLARDCAAVVPFDRSGHHAAVLPWADGDAAWADADGDI
jgi:hypothetical protein